MLKVPSQITKVSTMRDGALRLQVDTQELQPQDKAELMSLHQVAGWFVFSESGIQEADIPTDPVELDQKTPSQRLRAILYVYWQKLDGEHNKVAPFDVWYATQMERLIEHYKQKIDELN
jgi:hypothetical protein